MKKIWLFIILTFLPNVLLAQTTKEISINDLGFLKTGNSLEVLINGVKAIMISNWYSSENYQIEEFIVGLSKYDHNYAHNKGIENRNILDAE